MTECTNCSGPVSRKSRSGLCRKCHTGRGHVNRGLSHEHPLYGVWRGMIARCTNENFNGWEHYGGRGITVCERWRVFWNFADDMGPSFPGKTHWLERHDPDGNYEPGNCGWATPAEQRSNQRIHKQVKELREEVALWRGRAIEMGWNE